MKILGLTGPSGAGKGAAAAIFAKYGIPSIDTDAVYHELLEKNTDLITELTDAFGKQILDGNGRVDRKKLGAIVFGQENKPTLLHTLNTITHKYVMAKTHEMAQEHEKNGARALLIDAPQLFEAHIEGECDLILGVLADRETRKARIMARDGISEEAATRRMNAQRPDDFYRGACHHILTNDGDLSALEAQILRFLENSDLGV